MPVKQIAENEWIYIRQFRTDNKILIKDNRQVYLKLPKELIGKKVTITIKTEE